MMNAFSALLEARDPALGRFRSYRLEAGQDLFGTWLVELTYGRIGAPGRRLRYAASDEAEARKLVRHSLRRRATAERRIGVPYRLCQLTDPCEWVPVALLPPKHDGHQNNSSPVPLKVYGTAMQSLPRKAGDYRESP